MSTKPPTEPADRILTTAQSLTAADWRVVAEAIDDITSDRWQVGEEPWPRAFEVAEKLGPEGRDALADPGRLTRDDLMCIRAAVKVRFRRIDDMDEWASLHRVMELIDPRAI